MSSVPDLNELKSLLLDEGESSLDLNIINSRTNDFVLDDKLLINDEEEKMNEEDSADINK